MWDKCGRYHPLPHASHGSDAWVIFLDNIQVGMFLVGHYPNGDPTANLHLQRIVILPNFQVNNFFLTETILKTELRKKETKLPWGEETLDTNVYLRATLKVSVFENGQFSRHLIFDKKTFFSEKKHFCTPINKNFGFLKKKKMFLFLKKNVFSKNLKKIFDKFFVGRKVLEILKKNKVLVYRSEKFFCKKLSVR